MAQTIAEKLAEKYDVTPSTTIAGTLKKITKDETGDVNIASLVSKMEAGGGGSSRILLYENSALDFDNTGSGTLRFAQDLPLLTTYFVDDATAIKLTIEIDDEVKLSDFMTAQPGQDYVGLKNPGDSTGTATCGLAVCAITVTMTATVNRYIAYKIAYFTINTTDISAGTHSVKIYKEA